jgi:hypothetical protein
MNIIFGEDAASQVDDRYILLELDSFRLQENSHPIKTYCLIEKISLDEIFKLEHHRDLHQKLIENYYKKNWKFCLDALEHLHGQWNRELDSFYSVLQTRVFEFQSHDPGENWDGVVDKF